MSSTAHTLTSSTAVSQGHSAGRLIISTLQVVKLRPKSIELQSPHTLSRSPPKSRIHPMVSMLRVGGFICSSPDPSGAFDGALRTQVFKSFCG